MASSRYLLILVLVALPLAGQIDTGAVVGTVEDPGGLGIPDAKVTLTHVSSERLRQVITSATGDFVFSGLEPGAYRLTAGASGFKTLERRDLVLPAGVRLAVGRLTLQIGDVNQTISVSDQRGIVQTQSAERADMISSSQVENLQILGRNAPSLVGLLPGVVMVAETAALERNVQFSALGGRTTQNRVTVEGLPSTDLGNGVSLKLQPSMDAVAEVRILLSNYQAEYGNSAGANVEMILKSGTKAFHGLGSYFKRHEQFNANNFFNNRLGVPKSRYRFHTWTYNVGGPVYFPGKFNRNKEKLFFFWSQEFWPLKEATLYNITVPTELERNGDFSQSLDLNSRLIAVRDPQSRLPFPDNRIPANRIDRNGQALLRMFPLPNFANREISRGNYNLADNTEIEKPKVAYNLKVDYDINPYNLIFVTFGAYSEKEAGFQNVAGWQETWDQQYRVFKAGNKGLSTRYTRIISPHISNEFHFGWFTNPETLLSPEEAVTPIRRDTVGFTAGQLYPQNNKLKLIPNASFGGVTGAATLFINGRFPIDDPYHSLIWNDKLTIIRGTHSVKAGFLFDTFWLGRGAGAAGTTANPFGSFDFGRNATNPLDTGYAYSNAAAGVFDSYTESSSVAYFNARGSRQEFFVQDNWRVTRRLTLDFGMRMSLLTPIYDRDRMFSAFFPDRFDRAKQPRLITPGLDAQGTRVGVHPVTGTTYPAGLIGALAPGTGDTANGMVVPALDKSLPRGIRKQRGVQWGPRFGFALDPFGNGKTSVRGGIGVSYDQSPIAQSQALVGQIPLVQNPRLFYGTIPSLLSSVGFLFPTIATTVDPEGHIPNAISFSLSVQRSIGFLTVVDVGYVGSLGRHLPWQRNLNAIPYGTNFLTSSNDPTTNRPLPAAFLRPIQGYDDVNIRENGATSNYHSMQFSANRRFQRRVQFGLSWTWSKAMDYSSADPGNAVAVASSPFIARRVWNYGLSLYDRTHTFKLNWLYEVPAFPSRNPLAKAVLNGWQLNGITTFQSGAPLGVGYSTVAATDISGSPTEGTRIVVTGNPVLPKSDRTFDRFFRTEVFRVPAVGTFGNSARTILRGPGINNFDLSVFRNFPVRENMRFQFRCEFYNAFNHTQFNGVNTAARFDAAGNQVNQSLGQMTTARAARIGQMALRFYF